MSENTVINDEWRISWTKNKMYLLHHHPKAKTAKELEWVLCSLNEDDCEGPPQTDPMENPLGCKKRIHYSCRDPKCRLKVPGGVVAVGLTKRLSKANKNETF